MENDPPKHIILIFEGPDPEVTKRIEEMDRNFTIACLKSKEQRDRSMQKPKRR